MDNPQDMAGWFVAIFTGLAAAYERWQGIKAQKSTEVIRTRAIEAEQAQKSHEEILAAKDELVRIARETADQYKMKYQAEHDEFGAYRKSSHENVQNANNKILHLTEENSNLKAKTDITPIVKIMEDQAKINLKVLQSLEKLLEHHNINGQFGK